MKRHGLLLPCVALAAAIGLTATGCSASGGAGSSPAGGPATPKTAAAAVDYDPQPYADIKDGGTYTTAGTFDDQGNPFDADATLTAARVWFWYNADAITYSPTGAVQYNPDYYSHVAVKVTGGNQVVTLTINPKAVFNDGTPIDWKAIEATWKANNGSDSKFNASSTDGYDHITSVTAGVNAKQAVITFKGADASWPALFSTFLNPKAANVTDFNTAYLKKANAQWGTGPYTVGSWDTHSGDITFVRNPKWWGKRGKLDKRIFVNLESTAAVNAFRNGQVDYATTGDAEGLKQISGVKGTTIRRGGSPFEYALYLNTKSPELSELPVRKAIMEAIDRPQIARIEFQGLDYAEPLPGSGLLYSFQKGYEDNVAKVITHSARDAGKTLDADGWKPGADGVRVKNGKKLEVGYTLIGDDPLDKATAEAFVAMLKPIGVKVTIRTVDESDFAKVISTHDFDLFLSGNRSLDPFGQRYLCEQYCSTSPSNITGAGTAALDKQIKAVSQIADLTRQIAAANKVEQQELKQYAFLPLYSGPSIYGVKNGLANVGATIFGTPLPETIGWQK
ncbi:ABC transporter family substrate-binding protein [Streptomyces sp. SL13]|uniref:ABC transporter family substrate-binding protein n=1 Tax=Streptantibioticus silvisoli TaxID=2705255 RepID=A0AA90GWU4_9ACTN|nr:ABC transporter family substrate-binding protein [Streptantibioticus silvisoli]MDI5967896.1 ABC transporter family substrate-binding protein [Streptantibioticus silvisoli]